MNSVVNEHIVSFFRVNLRRKDGEWQPMNLLIDTGFDGEIELDAALHTKFNAGLWPGAVQIEALGGERFPRVQAVARDSDPLCQEDSLIPGRLPTPGSDDLEQTLLTTPHRKDVRVGIWASTACWHTPTV